MTETDRSDVTLALEGVKFIQKVAIQGRSPVWKDFSIVVDKEAEEHQGHVICNNCENIFKHVYVYSVLHVYSKNLVLLLVIIVTILLQDIIVQWFLTGGTRTPWGYEAVKQGVRSTKLFLGYTPRK